MEVGTVLSVDPMLWVEQEKGYIRCEDTLVVTEDGCEVFTAAAPLDCDEIEAVMKEPGLLQAFPTRSWSTAQSSPVVVAQHGRNR